MVLGCEKHGTWKTRGQVEKTRGLMENTVYGKHRVWKTRGVENTGFGKHGARKARGVENIACVAADSIAGEREEFESGEDASEIPACHIWYGFCLPPTFSTFDE